MNSFYFILASFVAISQLSHASFPYGGYLEGYPALAGYYGLTDLYPFAPFAYGAYPYGYPYGLHSHYYHPRASLRNVAKSFNIEDGHLTATDMISPIAKTVKN